MGDNYLQSSTHNGNNDHGQPPSPVIQRDNIKSKSHSQTKAQWKETIRKGCLERAKLARRERLRRSRTRNNNSDIDISSSNNGGLEGVPTHQSSVSSGRSGNSYNKQYKRGRDEWDISEVNNDLMVDHTPTENRSYPRLESGDSTDCVVNTARLLVEQELQRVMNGIQHCHQICPLDGSIPTKKKNYANQKSLDSMNSELSNETKLDEHDHEHEYKMSKEEFDQLLNDVQTELQRENELLEEEVWELERAGAMERERLMHQVDEFEHWEMQQQQQGQNMNPSTYISPLANSNMTSALVTCPICNHSSLKENPYEGITCTNTLCSFLLDIAHEGLTLNHLQEQLMRVYEEHSVVCSSGALSFRVQKRVGMTMLMAKCNACSSDVVVL